MALYWIVNSEERLFEVICHGVVVAEEVHQILDVLVPSEALGYRKLFDGSRGDTTMGALDILKIGVRMRSLHTEAVLGPLAVVIPPAKYELLSRVLGILASGKRPMRIFSDPKMARRWLDSPAVLAKVPSEFLQCPALGRTFAD